VACKDTLPSFRQCRHNSFWRKANTCQSRAHLLAEMLKPVLFRQKNEAVAQPQYGKGGTSSQPKVLAELFRDSELSLLSYLRSG
jgi:hypothetical protein